MSKWLKINLILLIAVIFTMSVPWLCPEAKGKKPKSKFYDFNEQIIDGEVKKPTVIYTSSRERVKFDRLLKLKKSFIPKLLDSAKERVFR